MKGLSFSLCLSLYLALPLSLSVSACLYCPLAVLLRAANVRKIDAVPCGALFPQRNPAATGVIRSFANDNKESNLFRAIGSSGGGCWHSNATLTQRSRSSLVAFRVGDARNKSQLNRSTRWMGSVFDGKSDAAPISERTKRLI